MRSGPISRSQFAPARAWGQAPRRPRRPGVRPRAAAALDVGAHVLQHDPAAAGAAAHPGEVNAQVARQLADRRRRGGRRPGLRLGARFRKLPPPAATGTCSGEGVWMSLSRLLAGAGSGLAAGAAAAAPLSLSERIRCPTLILSPAFTKILRDRARGGGRNGRDRLLVLQLEDGLVFGDRVAFFDEQVHHGARIGAFTEMRKFQVHSQDAAICPNRRVPANRDLGRLA